MERLDFHWRANARDLNLEPRVSGSKKTPDFVYDPGARHGFQQQSVVVVEAKGSLSGTRAKRNAILRLAEKAFNEQVRDFIGRKSSNLTVASGYAVAFGSIPRVETSTLAIASPQEVIVESVSLERAFSLSAAASGAAQAARAAVVQQIQRAPSQYKQDHGRGGDGGRGGGERRGEREWAQPTGRVAFANYEAVFRLCGAEKAAALLRTILSGQRVEQASATELVQQFYVIEQKGAKYLTAVGSYSWDGSGIFAIDERSASQILRAAATNLNGPPSSVSMSIVPEERRRGTIEDAEAAIHGDGLALLLGPQHQVPVHWDLLNPPEV
jgi:hypothetical protein